MEEPNPPAARTLAQKLDSMLLKAANMAVKSVVTAARLQTSSIFMRDMYGRVSKKGWFKK